MATTEKGRDLDRELTDLRQFIQEYDKRGIAGLDSFRIRKLEKHLDKVWKCLGEWKRELNKTKPK